MATNNPDTASTTAAAPAEPSMAEYAKLRLAGESVVKPALVAPAAAIETAEPAAATGDEVDPDAAATGTTGDEGTTTTASATEEDPEAQIEEAHPAKKGIQKRFSEMTAKQKDLQAQADEAKAATEAANRRAEQAEAEMQRLRAEADKAQATVPVVVDEKDDPAPNRNDYDDPDEFTAAISAHATRQELRRSTQAAQQAAQERAQAAQQAAIEAQQAKALEFATALQKKFQANVAAVKPEYPDYDEMVSNNEKIVMRNEIFFAIQRADDSAHILYHLAKNADELAKIDKLNSLDAAIRIGELQAELRNARKPKPSRAAAPIKPVGNRASPQPKTPDQETTEEYAERRTKEMQAAQKNRSRILS